METVFKKKGNGVIKKITWGFLETNMYVLCEKDSILVIDPNDSDDLIKYCRNASYVAVLLTHEHFDHICG